MKNYMNKYFFMKNKITDLIINFTKKRSSISLFDGDDHLFKEILLNVDTYGEYGCGASTEWVFKNTNANIYSVDSSKIWANKVKEISKKSNKIINWNLIL